TLLLGDGRRIQPAGACSFDRSISLHPEFRIIMLANRPGFPFLGNDLFGVLGDLFSVHAVDNPSRDSELKMLKKYAPDVPDAILLKLVAVFTELRKMADEGVLQYPYSTRELLFPSDSLSTVVGNVFDFDAFSPEALRTIQEIFLKHGIPFGDQHSHGRVFLSHRFPFDPSSSVGEWGVRDDTPVMNVRTTESTLKLKECAWQIPMLDVNICSDGVVVGSTLIVAAVNPPRLYIIENLDISNQIVVCSQFCKASLKCDIMDEN
ncbi:hypothetical protein DICVIV_13242, partial [Dictyocaulus viviparus]